MVNYFRSLSITAPLSISIGFMVVIFFAVRWIRRQLAGRAAGAAFHAYPERRARRRCAGRS